MRLQNCLWGLLLLSFQSQALESNGALYRDFSEPNLGRATGQCGSLCLQDVNYVDRIQLERDLSQRGFYQTPVVNSGLMYSPDFLLNRPYMSLSFRANSRLSRSVLERRVRWSMMARDVGISVSEQGRSLSSALWRQVRRPLLHEFRDRVLSPYRGKKLSVEEKIEAWLIEQSVESGASVFELEATADGAFDSDDFDFGISDYTLKYRPKVDPLKGRYGLRIRYKKHLSNTRPFFANLSYYYCNSGVAVQQGQCGYLHELSGRISTMTMRRKLRWSLYLSYQTESIDETAYLLENGIYVDHKPWLGGMQLTYAFFR